VASGRKLVIKEDRSSLVSTRLLRSSLLISLSHHWNITILLSHFTPLTYYYILLNYFLTSHHWHITIYYYITFSLHITIYITILLSHFTSLTLLYISLLLSHFTLLILLLLTALTILCSHYSLLITDYITPCLEPTNIYLIYYYYFLFKLIMRCSYSTYTVSILLTRVS